MFDLWFNPVSTRALQAWALGKAFRRFRDPRRRQAERHRCAFYDRAWREAAERLGGTYETIGGGIGEIRVDGFTTRVSAAWSAIDDPVTLQLLADKPLTYKLLDAEGLPTPPHLVFKRNDVRPAVGFLRQSGATPCVVKPGGGTGGGRGITTGIRTPGQLARAAALAGVYGDELLVERQVAGDNYRLLFLDGQLLDAFVRQPPTVVGDGRSTVACLVKQANAERLAAGSGHSQVLLTVDMDLHRTLDAQGLSYRSVPAAGRRVILKTVVNENRGDDNATVTDQLHPSLVDECARAAAVMGVRLSGVDVITADATRPLSETGGVMLEVNAPPNFYYHYHKRDGAYPVALHVLRRLMHAGGSSSTSLERGQGRELPTYMSV